MSSSRFLMSAGQVLALALCFLASEQLVARLHVPLPASVLGLLLLCAGMLLGVVQVRWLQLGATFLLGHMLLFFTPPMVALTAHPELNSLLGLKVMATVLIGTFSTLLAVAWVVKRVSQIEARRHGDAALPLTPELP